MISRLFCSTLAIITFICCSKNGITETVQPLPSDAISICEYNVLAAIIDSVHFSAKDSTIIVIDSTDPGVYTYNIDSSLTQLLHYVGQHLTILKPETMQNFKEKNLTHTIVQHPSSISPMCVLSSLAHAAYPVMQVSRVGFSSDGQQALAYVGFTWAPLAGSGTYYVLSQNNGKWNIVGSVVIWIS